MDLAVSVLQVVEIMVASTSCAFLRPSFVGLFCFITFYECIGMIVPCVQLGGLFLMVTR